MDLKKEQDYIKGFMKALTDEEFMLMLEECGNNIILPTQEIQQHLSKDGYYEENVRYARKSSYQLSEKLKGYDEYNTNDINRIQKGAA